MNDSMPNPAYEVPKRFRNTALFLPALCSLLTFVAALGWMWFSLNGHAAPSKEGTAFLMIGPILAAALVLFVWPVLYAGGDEQFNNLGMGMIGAIVLSLILGFTSPLIDVVNDYQLAQAALKRLDQAETITGNAPAIAEEVRAATASRAGIENNREFLVGVATADTNQDALLLHLAAAKALGVNAEFVQHNGMVRQQDRQELLNIALQQASQGNAMAGQWAQSMAVAQR